MLQKISHTHNILLLKKNLLYPSFILIFVRRTRKIIELVQSVYHQPRFCFIDILLISVNIEFKDSML